MSLAAGYFLDEARTTAAGAVGGAFEAEMLAVKVKHRIMLWYAMRTARKQLEQSTDLVASGQRKAGSTAAPRARSARAVTARSARSAGGATKSIGGRAAKSANASVREAPRAAKRGGRPARRRSSGSK